MRQVNFSQRYSLLEFNNTSPYLFSDYEQYLDFVAGINSQKTGFLVYQPGYSSPITAFQPLSGYIVLKKAGVNFSMDLPDLSKPDSIKLSRRYNIFTYPYDTPTDFTQYGDNIESVLITNPLGTGFITAQTGYSLPFTQFFPNSTYLVVVGSAVNIFNPNPGPVPTPSPTSTAALTPTPSTTPTQTSTPTASPTRTPTPTPTITLQSYDTASKASIQESYNLLKNINTPVKNYTNFSLLCTLGLNNFCNDWSGNQREWNPNFWGYGYRNTLNFSGVSLNTELNATLITPQHFISNTHFAPSLSCCFYDHNTGDPVHIRIQDYRNLGNDCYVGKLATPVPATSAIKIYKIAASTTNKVLLAYQFPLFYLGGKAFLTNDDCFHGGCVGSTAPGGSPTTDMFYIDTFSTSLPNVSAAFAGKDFASNGAVGGESSNPIFILLNGELNLLGSFWTSGGGPWWGANSTLAALTAAIIQMGSEGYSVSTVYLDQYIPPPPTPTVTPTVTVTPGLTPTITPIQTLTPTATPVTTSSPTPTQTPSQTRTPSQTPSITPTNTRTPAFTPSPTNTASPGLTPTATPSITPTNTRTPSQTPSVTPTNTKTPSNTPTNTITSSVTPTNTLTPSNTPTGSLTPSPTCTASPTPTPTLTTFLTPTPTPTVTRNPSITPTSTPTPTRTPPVTPTATYTPTPTPTLTSFLPPPPSPTPSPTSDSPGSQLIARDLFTAYSLGNVAVLSGGSRFTENGQIIANPVTATLVYDILNEYYYGSVTVLNYGQGFNQMGGIISFSPINNFVIDLITQYSLGNIFELSLGTGFDLPGVIFSKFILNQFDNLSGYNFGLLTALTGGFGFSQPGYIFDRKRWVPYDTLSGYNSGPISLLNGGFGFNSSGGFNKY